jgi:serine/threonine protein kinase
MEQSAALISMVCMFTLANAASPSAMSWHGDRSGFELALRAGRRVELANDRVVDRRQFSRVAVQRHASPLGDVYEVHGALGNGGFATVRRGVHRITGKIYAIKTIDLSKIRADQRESLRREIEVMKALDHPNLVKIHESFEDEHWLDLVLELGNGGNVFDKSSTPIMLDLFEYFLLNTSVLYPPSPNLSSIQRPDLAHA